MNCSTLVKFIFTPALLFSFSSFAQSDTLKNIRILKPRLYKDVITPKAISDIGLFTVHKVDEKYYFEIKDSLLGREILVVSRISKASAGMRNGSYLGYAGDQIGQNIIRFEKGPNNKLFIRSVSFAEQARDSASSMFTAVNKSNIQPIVMAFDIKAFSKDSSGIVIDVTDFVSGDNDVLFFNSLMKNAMRVGGQQADKSYISRVKSFPLNIEIVAVKTFGRGSAFSFLGNNNQSSASTSTDNLTMELTTSLVLLPQKPMQSRYYDPRVGYFSVGYTDFDSNPQGVENVNVVKRWRLEPKDEDLEKYKRGELVEPKKPIIFYIDPTTPKKWVPFLMQGIDDWQVAFEQAGFKNAIVAKRAPTPQEDPEWSLDDARYSAIVYKPSDILNASGPSISDPRSGEIIESHINWYHNVMKLIHDWYFVQCAPVDTGARKMIFDEELMGQLIRFVSSHEVGHALGLRHNFGSSSTVPVEKLRDKAWVEANGHTPSIMDYARFNYVAQPEDHIGRAGLFPRIGDYDKWAIQWGYKLFPQYRNADDEKSFLNNWVIEKMKNKRLFFGSESNPDDPRSQSEQVGDDAMKGNLYGIKNLQRIVPNLIAWTKEANKDYENLGDMYDQVVKQYTLYVGQVAKYIGGIMETPKTVEEKGAVYENVSKEQQKEAVSFLNTQLFETPFWLLNKEVFGKTGGNTLSTIGNIQDRTLYKIFSPRKLTKMIEMEAKDGDKAYTIAELFSDLKNGIWGELATKKKIDVYRRNLQKSYTTVLIGLLRGGYAGGEYSEMPVSSSNLGYIGRTDKTDIISVVRGQLVLLQKEIKTAAANTTDQMTKYHLEDMAYRIGKGLNPSQQ